MDSSIWRYIREAIQQCDITVAADQQLFAEGDEPTHSLLSSISRNRVLIFPGAFNPPHIGHLQLLDYVFKGAMEHLGIRAVIVFPYDDDRVQTKIQYEELPFCLTQEARARLWRESSWEFKDTWFYTDSRVSLKKFQTQLQTNLKSKGIHLGFLLLFGPDWMGSRGTYHPSQWGCGEAITSDISRPVDFRFPSSLRQLPGCNPWIISLMKEYSTEGESKWCYISRRLWGADTNVLYKTTAKHAGRHFSFGKQQPF